MLTSDPSDSSQTIFSLGIAPGLTLLDNVVIDSHFAERGRLSRLLGAATQNPRNLGLGIDEDTAVVVKRGSCFRVLGSGAVYVADGATMAYSSLSEERPAGVVTIHGVTLHSILMSCATTWARFLRPGRSGLPKLPERPYLQKPRHTWHKQLNRPRAPARCRAGSGQCCC